MTHPCIYCGKPYAPGHDCTQRMENKFKMHLIIHNNEKEIRETNYWETEYAAKRYFYLSINAGCVRLLIPENLSPMAIKDMRSFKQIVLSFLKPYITTEGQTIELMFDDKSNSPFAIHMNNAQIDRFLSKIEPGTVAHFIAYTKGLVKIIDTKCGIRLVNEIPCLKPWSNTHG